MNAGLEAGRAQFARRSIFSDPKRLHHAICGLFYLEDIFDAICRHLPLLARILWWRIDPRISQRKLLFIHVARSGGTSVCHALYGGRIDHYSIRYYRTIHPRFCEQVSSFALLRDPFERFKSAYFYVINRGAAMARLSDVFVAQTAHIVTVDDYLDFLESRDVSQLDFVMRPQSWFVCDLKTGEPLVKNLFRQGADDHRLKVFLRAHDAGNLLWLNRSRRQELELTPAQERRIERIYAHDFALIEMLAQDRYAQARIDAMPSHVMLLRTATSS
ncbi:MAG TPA: sulfotransferase family 2 domain-containing protein [Rhizomicrobium sp.]